ncbi:uncharacterized protein I303_106650 [Kwoniella dejecticola CBS 10117]|uniref:Enoyl reductase (ER) domain-containing protein n=1 Tax=Kwoniella dejecticola CBS 10117 TaxID=1296121 RepID=A0A1A5ZU53_9TREE|nr:uncharacterized protein I303_08707 [Kwoniella dejecticola CBS 10117]OBR81320.1 hypothetical protein I303_08707 [Kwoniella dejecticola CBS 10117]
MLEIPTKMKALRVHKAPSKHYTLDILPVPQISDEKVLLKIGCAGLCHTDLMVLEGSFGDNLPLIGSHEPAGTIVDLDQSVGRKYSLRKGDRVAALLPKDVCGNCSDCKFGDWKHCANSKYGGITTDGYFAEYALVEAKHCVIIPDEMGFEQAAPLTCAGVTIYTAIKKANLKPGEIIAISGLGALGTLGVQMAKAQGLKVVGIDTRPGPLELVRSFKLKPDVIIDGGKSSSEDAMKEIIKLRPEGYEGWDGVDATILTADPPSSHSYALSLTRRHGHVILVAQPPELSFNFKNFIFQDLTLSGSLHGNEVDLKETVKLVYKHGIASEIQTFSIDDHEKMVDATYHEGRKGKIVLSFE